MFDVLNYLSSSSINSVDKIFILLGIVGIPISIFGFGFAIFLLIYAIYSLLTPRPTPKCQVCQKLEPDQLSSGKEKWFLCREHLLPKYSDLFLKNIFRVVMVEFTDFKFKNPDNLVAFTYYPFSYHKDYDIGNSKTLKQLLESINTHKCAKCGAKAKVLFVNKENALRKDSYIVPSEEYLTKGHYLCNEHTLEKTTPALKNYPKPIIYDGGVWLPYKEDGFQRADEP